MSKRIFSLPALVFLLSNIIFSPASADKKVDEPLKLLPQEHTLIGKIWDTHDKSFIAKNKLLENVFTSDYVLLGETHDNIKHHQDHGWIIKEIANKSKQAAIAFEMLNQDQANVVNNVEFENTDELLEMLEQAGTGWEYKKYYKPVFDSVFRAKLPMYAADLGKETLMKIVTKGVEHAPKEVRELLEKTTLSKEAHESLKKEIEMTHCGMINDEMTRAMMLGQRVRDAAIGNSLFNMRNDPVETAILVAGSGHVRKDRGAPMYLESQDKNAKITSIAWLEIDKDTTDPQTYSKRWGTNQLPFDYVIFTAQVDRPDPCEEMKKFMQHKNNHDKKIRLRLFTLQR